MNAEIIAVGAEVLTGDVVNSDASNIASRLSELGVSVTRHVAVDDKEEDIVGALKQAIRRSHIVIFSGGLGPTPDDLTKEAVCAAVGLPLTENEESMNRIREYFQKLGRPMGENNKKQALFPKEAVLFPNDLGTADGCAVTAGNQCIILLPGPPRELIPMFDRYVMPFLQQFADTAVCSRTLRSFGMGESNIAERLNDLLTAPSPRVATYLGKGDVGIKITAAGKTQEECRRLCEETQAVILRRLGSVVYSTNNQTLPETVVSLLKKSGQKVATAESCTAGLLSAMLTEVPGASEVFEMGISAYANHVKTEELHVDPELIDQYGAVSREVAEAMAEGIRKKSGADFGLGITGLAGPGGATENKPVGLIYVSLSDSTRTYTRRLTSGHGTDRERNRLSAVMNALDLLRLRLTDRAALLTGLLPANSPVNVQAAVPEPEKMPAVKRPWYLRALSAVFPWKGDSPVSVIRKIILIACAIAIVVSLSYILHEFWLTRETENLNSDLAGMYDSDNGTLNEDGINIGFLELLQKNPETVGWISISGTAVNNPVVQTTDNTKYLTTDFEGGTNKHGTVFAEAGSTIARGNILSDNTVLYGHNMRDGTMFGELSHLKNLETYRQNPLIEFTTIYSDQTMYWKTFAVFIVTADAQSSFDYRQTNFASEAEYQYFVEECRARSILNLPVDTVYGDHFLTLSTCTYEFDDARLVVVGRLVRAGEDTSVNVAEASANTSVVYPAAYYAATGSNGTESVTHTQTASAPQVTVSSELPAQESSQAAVSSAPSSQGSSSRTSSAGAETSQSTAPSQPPSDSSENYSSEELPASSESTAESSVASAEPSQAPSSEPPAETSAEPSQASE